MATEIGRLVAFIDADTSGLSKALDDVAGKLQGFGSKLSAAGKTLTLGLTAPIVGIGAVALKASIDFESAFAGVRKTVDATDAELAELRQGIRDMAKELPASATSIAAVAEAAGQLGVKTGNILEFTRVMIDLGETTNLSADEAATALARLANIVQMPQDEFDRLGATIVDLGNKGASTEREIVEMALRIAGAGNQVGLTVPQILAFGEALSSVGIEADAGGSAISRTFIEIANAVAGGGEALAGFAKVAGMSAAEFQRAFKRDAATATISFIDGLRRISEEGGNVFAVLDELGLGEIRVRDALLRASGAGDLFRNSLETASKAWEENTALADEAAKRYETTGAKLAILRNRAVDVAITLGDALAPALLATMDALEPVISILGKGAELFARLPRPVQMAIIVFAGLLAAIGPMLLILGSLATAITTLLPLLPILGAAFAALLGPVGLVILAIAALVAVFATDFLGIRTAVVGAIEDIAGAVGNLAHLFQLGLGGGMIGGEFSGLEQAAFRLGQAFREHVVPVFNAAAEAVRLFVLGFQGGLIGGEFSKVEQAAFRLGQALREVVGFISANWAQIETILLLPLRRVGAFIEAWWQTQITLITASLDIIAGVLKVAWGLITLDFGLVWEGIKQIVSAAWEAINEMVATAIETLKTVISAHWEAIKAAASLAWQALGDEIRDKANQIKDDVIGAFNELKGGVAGALEDAAGVITGIMDRIVSIVDSIVSRIIRLVKEAKAAVASLPSPPDITPWTGFSPFQHGAWRVPATMPALVHEGEMILPAAEAAVVRAAVAGGEPSRGGDLIANFVAGGRTDDELRSFLYAAVEEFLTQRRSGTLLAGAPIASGIG